MTSPPSNPPPIGDVFNELHAFLGSRVTASRAVREHHGKDESYHPSALPDLVAFPHTTDEVSRLAAVCAARGVPMVPFGVGTSLEGHVLPVRGGVSIDMSQMNQIVSVGVGDLDAVVEAGVTRTQLTHHLRNTGLTFFVDPGADATLGGMAACGASGTTAVRYGTMRQNVLGLTVVLADGRVIHTGGHARKSSAGYDLTRLFVGSEGTLGIITELILRLHPQPEAIAAAVCAFGSMQGAVQTVISTIQLGIGVARIELLDEAQMDAVNRYSKLDHPVAPTLFFEFHGTSDDHLTEQANAVQALATEHGGAGFDWVLRPEDRARLWKARHDAYYAALALRPGSQALTTDVCVPVSRLADCIVETQRDTAGSFLKSTLVGHVGDGNFHVLFLIDPSRSQEVEEARRLSDRIVVRALDMGGTCTGEHGVGFGKLPFMAREHGEALAVMGAIKAALDPLNLLNPGKVVPWPAGEPGGGSLSAAPAGL